ncbi:MAG: hypothetical protein AMJ42_03375 [Deltaproteobacteria bacterium DG_8]|nr:MAG: hypothetical protein AMJ42_03375 [Deltaproteobacteria bacterium DG_8]
MDFNVYQPFLDYGFVPNPAVIFPTVISNYKWEIFEVISKNYHLCLKDFMLRENLKRKSALKDPLVLQQGSFAFFDDSGHTRVENFAKNPRGSGRKLTEFMSLLKSFICARYMDIDVNSRTICSLLNSNPAFLERMNYKDTRPPSYRVIDRFDQLMTENELWEKAAYLAIDTNIREKIIDPDQECFLILDTTHVPARAKKGKVVKACRECIFSQTCKFRVPTDDNAGVLTKSKTEKYYAHKVGLSTISRSAIPMDWFVDRGERFDGKFLEPLLNQFRDRYPQFEITEVIANGTFGSKDNEQLTEQILGARLLAPVNPRRCKEIEAPAHGIKKITKYGQPICLADFKMVLRGRSISTKEYIWVCAKLHPESQQYDPEYICELKEQCSSGRYGRTYRTKAQDFPQINWKFPQFSKEAQGLLALRTTIERDIS